MGSTPTRIKRYPEKINLYFTKCTLYLGAQYLRATNFDEEIYTLI